MLSIENFLYIKKCKVCDGALFEEPILIQRNMPSSAQDLPSAAVLNEDKGVDLEVYQCAECGLVQLTNEPVPYYKEVIRASAFSKEMGSFRLRQFKDFVERYSLQGKKVVEIGCGKGEFLSIMKESGADAYGIEYGSESQQECIKRGLNVTKEYIEKGTKEIKNGPFAAFFIMNFFEHIPDPGTTLKVLRDNLDSDGVGLIEVPNFNMMLKKELFSEFIGDHLFYFTKETLTSMLQRNGYEVLECKEIWYDYIISAVVRKRRALDLSGFNNKKDEIKQHLQNYIAKNQENKVAIWGAGHQAFAIMSLANLAGKISYVIDDAVFKQGKYTPATHIPIVSSEELKKNPVGAIIVMAGSYSDEVAKKIRQKFDDKLNVCILRDFGLENV